jgi:hypothetical protein
MTRLSASTASSSADADLWCVPPAWAGEIAVCIASGPSLRLEDIEACRDRARIIAVNENWRLAPLADVLFAADSAWWRERGPSRDEFGGLRVTTALDRAPGVHRLGWSRGIGSVSRDPDRLGLGGNSGYQALNLADLFGARRILLLGYDLKPGSDGRAHWHGDHGKTLRNPKPAQFKHWLGAFAQAAGKFRAEIINCSPCTALTCFPRLSLEDALALP